MRYAGFTHLLKPSGQLQKWLGLVFIVNAYFFVIRPLRVEFISVLVSIIEPALDQLSSIFMRHSSTTLIFNIGFGESSQPQTFQEYTYGPALNMFFVLATVGLWFIEELNSSIKTLVLIHVMGWFTASTCLFLALFVHPNWLVGSDLITVYLIPMASMALVALRYARQRT